MLQPAGHVIPDEYIETSYFNNPDGLGISYIDNGELKIYKTLKFKHFKKQYKHITKNYGDKPMLVHFRAGTAGSVNLQNAHPFFIKDKEFAFCHNGTIYPLTGDKNVSDTRRFNELVLKSLPDGFLKLKWLRNMINLFIGTSKLLFLDNKGNYDIIKEEAGIWDNGIWYSNWYFKQKYGVNQRTGAYTKDGTPTTPSKAPYSYKRLSYTRISVGDASIYIYENFAGSPKMCSVCGKAKTCRRICYLNENSKYSGDYVVCLTCKVTKGIVKKAKAATELYNNEHKAPKSLISSPHFKVQECDSCMDVFPQDELVHDLGAGYGGELALCKTCQKSFNNWDALESIPATSNIPF